MARAYPTFSMERVVSIRWIEDVYQYEFIMAYPASYQKGVLWVSPEDMPAFWGGKSGVNIYRHRKRYLRFMGCNPVQAHHLVVFGNYHAR